MPSPPTKRARSGGSPPQSDVARAEALAAQLAQAQAAGGMSGTLLAQSAQAVARQIERDPAAMCEALAEMPADFLEPVFKKLSYIALQPFQDSGRYAELLDSLALNKSMEETEDRLRHLFADPAEKATNPDIQDPHVMLMKPHVHPDAFEYHPGDEKEQALPRWFEDVAGSKDRPTSGPCICPPAEFQRNWDVFTMKQLSTLDWSNVFAAGGSVQACLEPWKGGKDKGGKADADASAEQSAPTLQEVRKHFLGNPSQYPAAGDRWGGGRDAKKDTILSSDVDLFVYGLDGEAATKKLFEIEAAIIENNAHEIIVVRTPQSVSFVSQHPYRHIQVILRCYKSPAEILMGFDLDSVTVGYDGTDVYCLPRFHRAITRGYNLVSQSRRSLTYESRLMKYALRGFCVAIPNLDMAKVDVDAIKTKEAKELSGGARLLWLWEKAKEKPGDYWRYVRPKKALLEKKKASYWERTPADFVDVEKGGDSLLQRFSQQAQWMKPRVANYEMYTGQGAADYSSVFLPWGPRWNAGRISTWLSEKTLSGMYGADDDESVRKAFQYGKSVNDIEGKYDSYGDSDDEDSDDSDEDAGPKMSKDLPERETDQVLKDIKLCLKWLTHEPGRQFIGSFHPEKGDWFEQLYSFGGSAASKDGNVEMGDATGDADDRPPCEYWDKCYRQNPEHRQQFLHPPGHDPSAVQQ